MTAALVGIAFLLGSIPTGVLLGRMTMGRDIREEGSGNFGAANVARAAGYGVGVAVALLDMAKGAIPVLLAVKIGSSQGGTALVALAAVLGHDFSIFLRLRGGKGVATTLGVILILSPVTALIALVAWIVIAVISRYASLASLVALGVLPIATILTGGPAAYVVLGIVLLLLGLAKHWENLLRLATGREAKFGSGRPAGGN